MRIMPSISSRPRATGREACLGLLAALLLVPSPAGAQNAAPAAADPDAIVDDAVPIEPKQYWQDRYRSLLERRIELRETIERERELYADANRRNYRRGDKRHRHRTAMLEAQAELEEVETALEALPDEARRAEVLPGWLYEVEEEFEGEEFPE